MHLDLTEEELQHLDRDTRYGVVVGKYTILGMLPHVTGKTKEYIIKCRVCAEDPYLFGLGIFTARFSAIEQANPCGCAKTFLYTEALQYKRVMRVVEEFGFKFIGFSGTYKGNSTKCIVACPYHGRNNNATVNNILAVNRPTCRGCFSEKMRAVTSGDYDSNVKRFMASGGFHEDTVFYRSERVSSGGQKSYWHMICGECGSVGESYASYLNKGFRSCDCPKGRQKQAYINLIYSEKETPIAIKFGISNIAALRINKQNSSNRFVSKQYEVYQFETKMACIAAEREVKSTIDTEFLTKEDFPDGYTETTSLKNLIEIQRIYKKHGGVSIMHVANETYHEGCVAFVESYLFDMDHSKDESAFFRTRHIFKEAKT